MPYWRLFYHLVWSTKNREPTLGPEEDALIRRSIHLTCDDLDLIPHAIGTMPDHLHFVVSVPPKVSISEAVKRLKGASANAVNHRVPEEQPGSFRWQGDYGALSFGDEALLKVVDYVTHQRERHSAKRLWTKLEQADDGFHDARPKVEEKP